MSKSRTATAYVCQQCGNDSQRWQGKCHRCGEWNSYVEFNPRTPGSTRRPLNPDLDGPRELSSITIERSDRLTVPIGEVNRVLGGGIAAGSVCLVAGDPGIGKSTLLLQIASSTAKSTGNVLYISGEESYSQIKMRAQRLGISGEGLFLLGATDLEEILAQLDSRGPQIAIVDSIQTTHTEDVPSWAGSVAQVRECSRRIAEWAKSRGKAVFIAGHVTKGGEVAGPKLLEHVVDVVLYLEGDTLGSLRILRGTKNRFGSTNEVGLFEMTGAGLQEVRDPSRALLSEHRNGAVGSVIIPTLEGSRPILTEVQALTSPSMLAVPRRVANGIDFNRMLLISAVLSRRSSLSVSGQDVIVSVAAGLKISEPAADLGIALAIASSLRGAPVKPLTAAIGEVGLSGEIRQAPNVGRRIEELTRLGFQRCLIPQSSYRMMKEETDIQLVPISHLAEGPSLALDLPPRAPSRAKGAGQPVGSAIEEEGR